MKIPDRERNEPPHVTIIRGTQSWRLNLRTGAFMDRVPSPKQLPPELVEHVKAHWDELVDAWDHLYSENPVSSQEAPHE